MSGYVYFVQPYYMIGTNQYKIGMSSLDNLSRAKSYGSGTRYLCILDCADALLVERELLEIFHAKYTCVKGNEYFAIDNELDALRLFIDIVIKFKLCKSEFTPISSKWFNKFAYTDPSQKNNNINDNITLLRNH